MKYAKEFEFTLGPIIYWYVDLLSGLLFLNIIVAMPKPSNWEYQLNLKKHSNMHHLKMYISLKIKQWLVEYSIHHSRLFVCTGS